MANCGIGACAYNGAACAQGILDIVIDVISGLIQAAMFILSFGSDAAAAPGITALRDAAKKVGQSAMNLTLRGLKDSIFKAGSKFFDYFKEKALEAVKELPDTVKDYGKDQLQDAAINQICSSVGQQLINNANKQSSADSSFDFTDLDPTGIASAVTNCQGVSSSDSNSQINCAKSVMNAIATVDPTGLVTIAAAFVQPHCDV